MKRTEQRAKIAPATRMAILTGIGLVAGTVLAGVLKAVQLATGNSAYVLLFNLDYMPILKRWNDLAGTGLAFHYVTCIASVLFLYYILRPLHLQFRILPYIVVYGAGGGILYFLSALTDTPPAPTDFPAWLYWTGGHAIFGLVSGGLIRMLGDNLLKENKVSSIGQKGKKFNKI